MEEREHVVGKSVTRVDALEKVTGRCIYGCISFGSKSAGRCR